MSETKSIHQCDDCMRKEVEHHAENAKLLLNKAETWMDDPSGLYAAAQIHATLAGVYATERQTLAYRSRETEVGWLEKALGGPLYVDGEGKIVDEQGEPYVQNGKQLTEADLA